MAVHQSSFFSEIQFLKTQRGLGVYFAEELSGGHVIQRLETTRFHDLDGCPDGVVVELSHTYLLVVYIQSFVELWILRRNAYRANVLVAFQCLDTA